MTANASKGCLKHLSPAHQRQLDESGIDPSVAAERGYYTAARRSEVPSVFKGYQQRPGLVIPSHSPDGKSTRTRLRPDRPRKGKDGKPRKYEHPAGSRLILDVHPRNFGAIKDPGVELWITEGEKKGDALTSRGLCAIAVPGVWGWVKKGSIPLPCWEHVALKGRRVFVVFDSDVMAKPEVQRALERLVRMLEERGADVRVIYLPENEKGVDDHLRAGLSVNELRALARRFEPQDIGRIRLSRDEKLRALVEDLERTLWDFRWKGQGGHTDRDAYLKLLEAARRHGKVVDGGVRVTISHGTLQLEAKIGSSRTLCKALNRLEEAELLYRDNPDREPDKPGAFVLRASVKYKGEKEGQKEKATQGLHSMYPPTLHLRAPRLRWSRPKFIPKRGVVTGTRKVRQTPRREPRDRIVRLGKTRGAILDALDVAGGAATLEDLAAALHKKRPRDLRRRLLPMLEEAGIVEVVGDAVSLAEDWLERLEAERERGQEIEADEVARERLKLKREAFHRRHEIKPDRAPTDAELAAQREAFRAALERQKRAREDRMRGAALKAFRAHRSGAAVNLELMMGGEQVGAEYLVKSVLAYHRIPEVTWARVWERWREPVLEAAAVIAREHAPPPADDWREHALDCECLACTSPEPRYARPRQERRGA